MNARGLKTLGYVVFSGAVIGWLIVAYLYFFQDTPGAIVDVPDREFPALAVGKNDVQFRLRNPTRHDIRVVGYQFC
jgi:hypothetical protein